jgi:hypothetical protein
MFRVKSGYGEGGLLTGCQEDGPSDALQVERRQPGFLI